MNKITFLPELQYLRAIAIIMTLGAHLAFVMSAPDPRYYSFVVNYAQFWGGVEIFFCLSGYIISKSLFPDFDKYKNFTMVISSFYLKRFFRIVPAAFFWASFVLFMAFIDLPGNHFGEISDTFKHFLASIFFVENIYLTFNPEGYLAHYWSLATEEQFYLIAPFFYFLFFRSKRKFMAVIIFLIFIQAIIPRPVDQSNLLSNVRYEAILYGVLIYALEREGLLNRLFNFFRSKKWINIILIIASFFFLIHGPILAKGIKYPVTVVDFAAFVIVLIAVSQVGLFHFDNNFAHKVAMWFGSRSYSMYLCHIPIFYTIVEIEKSYDIGIAATSIFDLRILLALAIVMLLSEFSFKLIETPPRAYGRKLAHQYLEKSN